MPSQLPVLERVAHRGASRERRENTLPAFTLALDRGATAVELDVHVSSDGVVVVHHDNDASGKAIAQTSWKELASIPLPGDGRIPRLEDVLREIGDRATVYIELKGAGSEAAALSVAKKHGRRFAVHSFDHSAVERAKSIAPDVPRGVLLDRGTPNAPAALREAFRRTTARDAWPHFSLVDEPFMAAARELNARVIPWTVNSADDARRLADLGVAGLCTDDVRLLDGL